MRDKGERKGGKVFALKSPGVGDRKPSLSKRGEKEEKSTHQGRSGKKEANHLTKEMAIRKKKPKVKGSGELRWREKIED